MKKVFTLTALAVSLAGFSFAQETEPVNANPLPSVGSPAGPLTTDVEELNNQLPVQIYSYGNEIFINAPKHSSVKGTVNIYELTGRLVYSSNLQNKNLNTFSSTALAGSYYLVNVSLNGSNYNAKVFVK